MKYVLHYINKIIINYTMCIISYNFDGFLSCNRIKFNGSKCPYIKKNYEVKNSMTVMTSMSATIRIFYR